MAKVEDQWRKYIFKLSYNTFRKTSIQVTVGVERDHHSEGGVSLCLVSLYDFRGKLMAVPME